MEYLWGTTRRFNALVDHFKISFGERVQKISINAGFSCPNRTKKELKPCSFCNEHAFYPAYCNPKLPITRQLEEGIKFFRFRYRRCKKFLAYFQANTNTFASLSVLKRKYEEALAHQDIVGLVIGTRPDCIDEEKLDYLARLNEKFYISVEYGIESCYDKTLKRINRGHGFKDAVKAIELTAKRNIFVGGHLIFGLPGESYQQMIKEARIISDLPINSLKMHQLQFFNKTQLYKDFLNQPEDFFIFDENTYLNFVIEFLELLKPNIMIERFFSEVPPRYLAISAWNNVRYDQLLKKLEKQLEEKNTWQGRRL